MTGRARAALFLLPLAYFASAVWMRSGMGPYWAWHAIDPSYFYLFDALNLLHGQAPGHMAHPGIPLDALGALVLMAAHPGDGAAAITQAVLADPESALRAIGAAQFALNAVALLFAGWAGLRAFGELGPAMVLQAGPLLSSVVMRHGLYVKPESLLIFVAAMLTGLMVLTLRSENKTRCAVGFGLLAGFGVALKLTAAPLFLAPVFLLWGVRPLAVYAATAFGALILFALPALGAWDLFLDYAAGIATHSSYFGHGGTGFLDWAEYPHQVKRMLARPVMFAPLLLAAGAVSYAVRRGWWSRPEIKALAGFALAQFAAVLMVAKHPGAHYLVASYVFAALGIALLWRAIADFGLGAPRARQWGRRVTVVLMLGILAAQGRSVAVQHDRLAGWRAEAARVDSRAFARCVRIHYQFASDPVFALMYGGHITKDKHADALAALIPPGDIWFDLVSGAFRDARGPVDIHAALADARCVLIRGNDLDDRAVALDALVPDLGPKRSCDTRFERITAIGAACDGTPLSPAP